MIWLILSLALSARADFFEDRWVELRPQMRDDQWPMTPPSAFDEPLPLPPTLEREWTSRWSTLARQYLRSLRVALTLAADGHERAAATERPVLLATLGRMNAMPGSDDVFVHAIVTSFFTVLDEMSPLEGQARARVGDFMRELAAEAASMDALDRFATSRGDHDRLQTRLHKIVTFATTAAMTTPAQLGLLLYFQPDLSNAPLLNASMFVAPLVVGGTVTAVFGPKTPPRPKPADPNRVIEYVRQSCADILRGET